MAVKKDKIQSVLFTAAAILVSAAVLIAAWQRAQSLRKISYIEHLDDVAVTVDETELKFRDLAFYLAFQELAIHEQAKVYDLKQTSKFWNLHVNGSFIRLEGKAFAVEQAVHDLIFYWEAVDDGEALNQEETDYMTNRKTDFWNDLEEDGQKRLGVSESEIDQVFEQMALAQKAQQSLADEKGVDYREYNVNGSMYLDVLQEHDVQINEKLWKRLNFGSIIVGQRISTPGAPLNRKESYV